MSATADVPGAPATCTARGAAPSRTALVVDDYPAVLAWAARAFQRAGWTVLTATDAGEARAHWAQARAAGTPVSLLVTDLALPGVDGPTLARGLRAEDPALAVVGISGFDAPDAGWGGPLLDRTAFFRKPVRAAELVAGAEALLRAPALADEEPCPVEPGTARP